MSEELREGIRLYRIKNYTDALTRFLSIPSKTSEAGIDLAYYIGLSYARLLRYDDALSYLEQVVTSGTDMPRMYQCRLLLAIIYTLTGRIRLADFELKKLIESGYESAQVFCSLAYIAWEQHRGEDAVELYEKVLLLDENNTTAMNGLGYVLTCMGKDVTRALSLCKKAVNTKPENAAYLDSLGWVYFNLGLKKDALSYLKKAKEKNAAAGEIQEHLSVLRESLRDEKDGFR